MGATINAQHKTKGLQRTTTSNTNGKYDFRNLPVGEYILSVSSKGHSATKSNILISVGTPLLIENVLVSGAYEELVVYGTMVDGLNMSEATAGLSFDADNTVLMPIDNGFENLVLLTANTDEHGKPTPRGTTGTLPWTKTLDLSLTYQNDTIFNKLLFKTTIYNLFNDDTETAIYNNSVHPHFGQPITFTEPRHLSVTARLEF